MRARGINYDTGFLPGGRLSRTDFDPRVVEAEMRVIAEELHCTAVRISGGDPDRLSTAGRLAAAAGLEVWFAPFPCELTAEEMLPLFTDCARRAEELRISGAEVVLVTGCELSLFARGFLPGASVHERIDALVHADPRTRAALPDAVSRMNAFLAEAVAAARECFGGRITYASGPWERVEWSPFDIVAGDAYRAEHNTARFEDEVRGLFRHGKPVAVTEFGCCSYRGAAARGGSGWMIVDRAAEPARLDGEYTRDEEEQAGYLTELLDVFERAGVDSAFWFTFAGYELPHDPHDPRHDLDLASYGVVRMLPAGRSGTTHPAMAWEPKRAFHAMATAYGS